MSNTRRWLIYAPLYVTALILESIGWVLGGPSAVFYFGAETLMRAALHQAKRDRRVGLSDRRCSAAKPPQVKGETSHD
jgi:hypothetical protein